MRSPWQITESPAYIATLLCVTAKTPCITVEDVTRKLEKRHVIDHKVKQERMQ